MVQDYFLWKFQRHFIKCVKRVTLAFMQFSLALAVMFHRHFRGICMWSLLSALFFFLLFMLNAFYHYFSFILLLFKYGHHVYIRTKKKKQSFFLTFAQMYHVTSCRTWYYVATPQAHFCIQFSTFMLWVITASSVKNYFCFYSFFKE